jgi:hypothetical protein
VTVVPKVLSFVLCHAAHNDDSGKAYLLGVYNSFGSDAFPAAVGQSVAYMCFAGSRGAVGVLVRLVDAAELDGPALYACEFPVRFDDPLSTPEVGLVLPPIAFARAGVYAWQVLCAGEVIYERRIPVQQLG